MAAVPFDTLKLARRFETAGFAPKQAADMSEALAEAMSGADLATKADLEAAIAPVRSEIALLRVEFRAEISLVLRDIDLLRRIMTIRLGGMLVVAVGILLAGVKYMLMLH